MNAGSYPGIDAMTTQADPQDKAHLRELAQSLDCLTEEEHLLLSGWAPETAKAKRKRGEGPAYIRHGLHYFYPREQYAQYLQQRVRATRVPASASVL